MVYEVNINEKMEINNMWYLIIIAIIIIVGIYYYRKDYGERNFPLNRYCLSCHKRFPDNQKMTAPIFEYDERYITASKYTREELYKLQEIVLEQMKINPTTYTYELKKIDNYDQKEIDIILVRYDSRK